MTLLPKGRIVRAGLPRRTSGLFSQPLSQHRPVPGQIRRNLKKPLLVMKFGGTSVGDASCMEKAVDIIRAAARDGNVVVVVSAMSGVTNKLIEAAKQSETGNPKLVAKILDELCTQHDAVASDLVQSAVERNRISRKMQELFQEGNRLCESTGLSRELTLRTSDAISSLGERLSALLIAAKLAERGVASNAVEATELVVTDSNHGAAEPRMDLTRERCAARLRPLLQQGITPVITGFIGATIDGVLTTLGRGGSDYSATILGAALDADEVIIWTDVDGLMTTDPRLVPEACTISEISYREAAELAYFGAKVLHPKTLRPVMESGIPLWIRNTFAPDRPGTKITPTGLRNGEVTALTSLRDVTLITIGGPRISEVRDILERTFTTTAAVRVDMLLISQAPSQNDLCLVIPSAIAKRTAEALRHEFAHDLAHEHMEHINLDPTVAIITVVGHSLRDMSGILGRTVDALDRENVNIIATAQGPSECTISFVVATKDVNIALASIHQEFQLGGSLNRTVAGDKNYYQPCEPGRTNHRSDQEL
jgi:bifunctional aspartokinase / homoserine dehydrogenase 1